VLGEQGTLFDHFGSGSLVDALRTPRRTGGAHNGAAVLHSAVPLHSLGAPAVAAGDWTAAVDQMVDAVVTRLARDELAAVLAELADGTAPSTIARKVGVGYATVARIAETTKRLQPAVDGKISGEPANWSRL
jgi:hypothetical protein